MRFRGAVAWAKFELPKPTEPPRYRAGVEFIDADMRRWTSIRRSKTRQARTDRGHGKGFSRSPARRHESLAR